jgi:hypothetical protein
MPRTSSTAPRARRTRKSADGGNRSPRIPELPSPLAVTEFDRRVAGAVQKIMRQPSGSRSFLDGAAKLRDLEIGQIWQTLGIDREFTLAWPPFLFIPSEADFKAHWPFVAPPDSNRYALDWTSTPIGVANASRKDGSLFAWTPSPTVKGAIDGKAEAGLGVLFTPKHTLSRVRVEPELIFTGRHAWSVNVDPVVWVNTRVIGSIYVGGYQQNPVTGGFESMPNVPWRRHIVFDQSNSGSGASAMVTVPFNLKGQPAGAEVLVEAGRTYLLAVVAQMVLRIETTNSSGQPVTVRNGQFDTWGSLAGIVREIWLDETVFIK